MIVALLLFFSLPGIIQDAFLQNHIDLLLAHQSYTLTYIEGLTPEMERLTSLQAEGVLKAFFKEHRIKEAEIKEYLIGNAPEGIHFFHAHLCFQDGCWYGFLAVRLHKQQLHLMELRLFPQP